MRNLILPVIGLALVFSVGFGADSSPFELNAGQNGEIRIDFTNSYTVSNETGRQRIESEFAGKTTQTGVPDLPVFSTFIQLQPGIAYSASFTVVASTTLYGINLLPAKGIFFDTDRTANAEQGIQLMNAESVYPESSIILSDPMVMRGVEVALLNFIPFTYYPNTHELEVFDQVEISVTESGTRALGISYQMPPSLAFEPFYKSVILNYDANTRIEDYQQPAILYICGGGSNGSIVHPVFQQLVEWRRQKGYKVYTASTDETGSSNNSIKSYITNAYQTYNPPPEFVGLVGDVGGSYGVPTFNENWSWYNGEGDMPYSQLDGNDLLPEVFVGRLSAESSTQLSVIGVKTMDYEKATHIAETGDDWYVSAALVGDPSSSGLSTITTNQYIETIMYAWGMEYINTNYGNGNYSNWMQTQLSNGIGYFNYRGYIGVSGFGSGNINNATNVWKTPFVTFLTCSTGSFSWGEAISESFLRAGTVSNPKGGVGAVGTATSGTHTAFNNIAEMGIYEGIYSREIETTGAALAAGKLALLHAYPSDPANKVSIFSHWNNLMGDPAVHLWTLRPRELNVELPSTISAGSNLIDILVTDSETDTPLEGVRVVVTQGSNTSFTGFTDTDGHAMVMIDSGLSGVITITAVMKNYIPYQESISVTGALLAIAADDLNLIETIGNNDGVANPGETIQIEIPITNNGTTTLTGLVANLTTNSGDVQIFSGTSGIDQLTSGMTANFNFVVSIAGSSIQDEDLGLVMAITDDSTNSWGNIIPVMVAAPSLQPASYSITGGGMLNPGMSVDFDILVSNDGTLPSGEFTVIIDEIGPWNYFEIDDNLASYSNIPGGQSGYSLDGFHLTTSDNIVHGSMLPVSVNITNADGYDRTEILIVQVGEVSVTDPLGPDSHGYYIYDSGDLGYTLAMPYSWIEIDPDFGGAGTSLGLNDSGYGAPVSQQPAHVDIPFTFTFYGVDYDEITVTSNGWIALGYSDMSSFRNYELPGAGGPSPMIAAFWDDLKTSNSGQAYRYFDTNNEQVIIEWSGMRTYDQSSEETFQVILMNSITPTGDDEILIQYKVFNNTTVGNMEGGGVTHGDYSTIGIENHLGNVGLQYTFNNQYPVAAMPLQNETALFITTRQPTSLLKGDVNMDGELNILDIILVVNDVINIETLGPLEQYIADMNEDSIVNVLDVILIINDILAQ